MVKYLGSMYASTLKASIRSTVSNYRPPAPCNGVVSSSSSSRGNLMRCRRVRRCSLETSTMPSFFWFRPVSVTGSKSRGSMNEISDKLRRHCGAWRVDWVCFTVSLPPVDAGRTDVHVQCQRMQLTYSRQPGDSTNTLQRLLSWVEMASALTESPATADNSR